MIVKLKNVRLSFPKIFKPGHFGEDTSGDPRYEATFIMDKQQHAASIKEIRTGILQMLNDEYNNKPPKGFKICLRDGIEKEDTDGYGAGVMFVSTSADGKKSRPPVVDRDLTPLDESDAKPYAGCHVNATVRFWVQDNKWGKRINAQYRAIQFYKDGEPFGDAPVNVDEEFEALEDDSEGLDALGGGDGDEDDLSALGL